MHTISNYNFPNETFINQRIYGQDGVEAANTIARILENRGCLALSLNGRAITIFNTSSVSHFNFQTFLKQIPSRNGWAPVICGRDSCNNLKIELQQKKPSLIDLSSPMSKITKSHKTQPITLKMLEATGHISQNLQLVAREKMNIV